MRERGTADSDFHAAKTIFGELVCNVVRHAPGPIWIEVAWTNEGRARLRVRDTGPSFQYVHHLPDDLLSESGRGLYIVSKLGDDMQITRDSQGSIVAVTLPVNVV